MEHLKVVKGALHFLAIRGLGVRSIASRMPPFSYRLNRKELLTPSHPRIEKRRFPKLIYLIDLRRYRGLAVMRVEPSRGLAIHGNYSLTRFAVGRYVSIWFRVIRGGSCGADGAYIHVMRGLFLPVRAA